MDILERIDLIIESDNLTREKFAEKVGINYVRIANMFSGRAKVRHTDIEAIGNTYPEYMMWLAYEKEIPEVGQIKPIVPPKSIDSKKPGMPSLISQKRKKSAQHHPSLKMA